MCTRKRKVLVNCLDYWLVVSYSESIADMTSIVILLRNRKNQCTFLSRVKCALIDFLGACKLAVLESVNRFLIFSITASNFRFTFFM